MCDATAEVIATVPLTKTRDATTETEPVPAGNSKRRVALVTGGAVRVGRAIAIALAEAGLDVAITYRRSDREADRTVEAIRERGANGRCFRFDLNDVNAIPAEVSNVAGSMGGLDVVVASASVFDRTPFEETRPEDWDRQMEVNAKAQFFLVQAALPYLRKARDGCVVTLLDTSTHRPWSGYLPYTASKAALEALTIGWARALAPEVRVNGVAPGPVMPPNDYGDAELERAAKGTLLKRWGRPEDVAAAVRFLVAESDYVTGVIVPVDGGRAVSG